MIKVLQPYISLIKAAAVAALLTVVWIKGCTYGEERKAQEVANLTRQVQELRRETAGYHAAEELRKAEIEKAIEEARARAEVSEQAAKETARLRESLAQKEKELALAEAYNRPSCAALLKEKVCDYVPLP